MTPTPAERATFNPCQNRRCGHRFDQHDRYGRCNAYHCRCHSFRALSEREYQEGRR